VDAAERPWKLVVPQLWNIWRYREDQSMFSDRVLAGKKILITGGGSGIGKSLGTRFLELGAEIVICGRRGRYLRGR